MGPSGSGKSTPMHCMEASTDDQSSIESSMPWASRPRRAASSRSGGIVSNSVPPISSQRTRPGRIPGLHRYTLAFEVPQRRRVRRDAPDHSRPRRQAWQLDSPGAAGRRPRGVQTCGADCRLCASPFVLARPSTTVSDRVDMIQDFAPRRSPFSPTIPPGRCDPRLQE